MEYEILGLKVKVSPEDQAESNIGAEKVINFISNEIEELRKKSPNLSDQKLAVLLALKVSKENLAMKNDLADKVEDFQNSTKQALRFIEEISPSV